MMRACDVCNLVQEDRFDCAACLDLRTQSTSWGWTALQQHLFRSFWITLCDTLVHSCEATGIVKSATMRYSRHLFRCVGQMRLEAQQSGWEAKCEVLERRLATEAGEAARNTAAFDVLKLEVRPSGNPSSPGPRSKHSHLWRVWLFQDKKRCAKLHASAGRVRSEFQSLELRVQGLG